MGVNGLCAFEAQTGKPFGVLLLELGVFGLETMQIATLRAFLRACCQSPIASDEAMGDLMDTAGLATIGTLVNGLVKVAVTS